MKIYKSASAIERSGACHRNSVKKWIEDGKIIEVYNEKRYTLIGYAIRAEVIEELLKKL